MYKKGRYLFLSDFCQDKNKELDILATYFEHLSRKHWSWTPTNDEYQELKSLLKGDFIPVNNTIAETQDRITRKRKKNNSSNQRPSQKRKLRDTPYSRKTMNSKTDNKQR